MIVCWKGCFMATETEVWPVRELNDIEKRALDDYVYLGSELVGRTAKDMDGVVKKGWMNLGERARQVARESRQRLRIATKEWTKENQAKIMRGEKMKREEGVSRRRL